MRQTNTDRHKTYKRFGSMSIEVYNFMSRLALVCIQTYTHVYKYTQKGFYIHTHTHTHRHYNLSGKKNFYKRTCTCIDLRTCTHIHPHTLAYIYTITHAHLHTCTHTHLHMYSIWDIGLQMYRHACKEANMHSYI